MAAMAILQVRTNHEDKQKASAILESLGTNLSAVVNMLLKQIIITGGIPFDIKQKRTAYTIEESIRETKATLALEGMDLTEQEVQMLQDYAHGKVSINELKRQMIDSITEADRTFQGEAV